MTFTDPSFSLQKAIVAKLKATPAVSGVVGSRVFDLVKPDAKAPYVNVGEMAISPELGEATDAADASVVIHAWSEEVGFPQVKTLGAAIVAALHDQEIEIDKGVVQSFLLETARYVRDPDGISSHGIFTFNILTDANS